jgi:pimeloyl-ACP methyl ester carboxylesterase
MKMLFFDSAGIKIHYSDVGAGEAVVLVHGFASTVEHNWGGTGWIAALSKKYRVIAVDVRGHGLSDKPREPRSYGYANMGADVTRLMDHLGIERALLMGYSMGASIAIELMLSRPERFRAIVLGNRVRRRSGRQGRSRRDFGGLPRGRSHDDQESGGKSVSAIRRVDAQRLKGVGRAD